MTDNQDDNNKQQNKEDIKYDNTLYFITYNSSTLSDGKYKYESITNKLIEVNIIFNLFISLIKIELSQDL